MSLFSLGLVRAIVGQIVGTLVGMATTILFRVMLGLPAWAAEPSWTLGAVFGIIGAFPVEWTSPTMDGQGSNVPIETLKLRFHTMTMVARHVI